MFCPKCSQQQAAEQQRFCSRCGFALGGVADLMAADGARPASEKGESERTRSPRFEGIRQGVILLMLAVVLLPLVDIIPGPYHEALVFMLLLAGIMRAGYAVIFQAGAGSSLPVSEPIGSDTAIESSETESARALPPVQSMPAADYVSPRKKAAEAAEPLSVTENTTRQLNEL